MLIRLSTYWYMPLMFVLFTTLSLSTALISPPGIGPTSYPRPKAISDLKEAIVKGLGFQSDDDDLKITGFDMRDALVGHSVAYEFDVEVDKQVIPLKLLEDVNQWDFVDLPIFSVGQGDETGLVDQQRSDSGLPVLAPFQLAGPMEIWIQDAKDMRLSLPHDVDGGVLKKVILADGAVVVVKGARSVSLRHPIDLPLPLNQTQTGLASGLLALARHLRRASQTDGSPLLSLRIVGPTSLTSPSSPSPSSNNRLKLKRLAPGLVELSSPAKPQPTDAISPLNLKEATAILTPKHFATMWPIASMNGSNTNLLGFEKLLLSVLGPKAYKEGSFKLVKADVSAQTFLKIGFGVEKKLKEGDAGFNWQGYPEWRTKPESVRMHFEVLAKVNGQKVVPERVMQINPMLIEDTVAPNLLTGNMTMSKIPIVHPTFSPLTL